MLRRLDRIRFRGHRREDFLDLVESPNASDTECGDEGPLRTPRTSPRDSEELRDPVSVRAASPPLGLGPPALGGGLLIPRWPGRAWPRAECVLPSRSGTSTACSSQHLSPRRRWGTSPVGLVPRSRMRRPLRHQGLLPPWGCPGWRAGPPGHAGVCVPVPQPLAGPHPPMQRQRPLWASWGAVHGSSRYPGAPVLGTVATVGARHQGPWLLEASVSSGVGWGRAPCGPLSGRTDCRTHLVEKPRPAPQRCG